MIDINLIRTNPELVKENIKKKFQDAKLPLVDEVLALDKQNRDLKQQGDNLRAERKTLSAQVGMLMKDKKLAEAEEIKAKVKADADKLVEIENKQVEIDEQIKKIMMTIPNILDASVPVGKDD
ncbi:MAG: serine--tRNA ligase, partial [Eubacteriales bacterium]|nr:serine--tRNA ligase [Eubacteriales bacterium]